MLLTNIGLHAQCTPGDSLSCPDPESNGQICPVDLPPAMTEVLYSEEFTILAPPLYVLDTANNVTIDLHHITLVNVDNLPDGLTWVSNSEDSVFMVGTYYCVLLEGIPTVVGNFPLKIVVDVYIPGIQGSPPIFLGTVTDSTSLAIDVNPFGVDEFKNALFRIIGNSPNPFNEYLNVTYFVDEPKEVVFTLYDLPGKPVYQKGFDAVRGENKITIDGTRFNPGVYIYSLGDNQKQLMHRVIKTN